MPDSLPTTSQPRSRVAVRRQPRDQRVRRFKRQLLEVAPHLNDPKFGPLLHSFARISLLSLDSYEYLRANGLVGSDGELRSSVDVVQRLATSSLRLATALGLTPLALGKLKSPDPNEVGKLLSDGE
jgi:hypothetical protein